MIFKMPEKYITLLKDHVLSASVALKDGSSVDISRSLLALNNMLVDRNADPFNSYPNEWFALPAEPRVELWRKMLELEPKITSRMAMVITTTTQKKFVFVRVPEDGLIEKVGTAEDFEGGYIVEVAASNAIGRSDFEALAHRLDTNWAITAIEIVDSHAEDLFEVVEKYCRFKADWYKAENSSGGANITAFMSADDVGAEIQNGYGSGYSYRGIGILSIRLKRKECDK